jgi:hypothetical protein
MTSFKDLAQQRRSHRKFTQQEIDADDLKLILRAQIVIMHHIVDGNGVENLKCMQRQIEEFLVYGRAPE